MYKRPESRGPAAPLPGAGQGQDGPGCTHPHPLSLSCSRAVAAHMHGRRPQVGGNSSSAFPLTYFRTSVPTGTRGAGGAPLIHATSGAPVGPWARGKSCDLAAHTGRERARLFMQLRGTGTQRGLREGSSGGCSRGPGAQRMQHKQHRTRQGQKRDFYLFSPSSPGISKPWPPALCAQRLKAEGPRVQGAGPGPGIGLRCGSAVTATSRSFGLRGRRGQEPSPQLDSGCWRAGCLPRQGAV